ncbi:hypothetical protein EJB05_42571, partial [Eragrostis curvula]
VSRIWKLPLSFGCPNPHRDLGPFHRGNSARGSTPPAILGHHLNVRWAKISPRQFPCSSSIPGEREKKNSSAVLPFLPRRLARLSRADAPSLSLAPDSTPPPQIVRPLHVDLSPRNFGIQFTPSSPIPPFPTRPSLGTSPSPKGAAACRRHGGSAGMMAHGIFSPLTPKWHNGLSTLVDGDVIVAGKIPFVILIHGKFPP